MVGDQDAARPRRGLAETELEPAANSGGPTRAARGAADDAPAVEADHATTEVGAVATPQRSGRKISTLLVGLLAGVLIGATAITAAGDDLRPDRSNDITELVAQQERRNEELAAQAEALRQQNEELAAAQGAAPAPPDAEQQQLGQIAGLGAVVGPAVRVTLTDAPVDFAPPGVSGDLLVVHEQDIQQVVNALWAAGAEAMTIQGQRVIATTAVKCVGNTVVLHGTPYAPPYVITAIGEQGTLEAGLAADDGVQIYRQYAQVYQLGYAQQRVDEVTMPAYTGPLPQQAAAADQP